MQESVATRTDAKVAAEVEGQPTLMPLPAALLCIFVSCCNAASPAQMRVEIEPYSMLSLTRSTSSTIRTNAAHTSNGRALSTYTGEEQRSNSTPVQRDATASINSSDGMMPGHTLQ